MFTKVTLSDDGSVKTVGEAASIVDLLTADVCGPTDPIELISHLSLERLAAALGRTFPSLEAVLEFAREHADVLISLGEATDLDRDNEHGRWMTKG